MLAEVLNHSGFRRLTIYVVSILKPQKRKKKEEKRERKRNPKILETVFMSHWLCWVTCPFMNQSPWPGEGEPYLSQIVQHSKNKCEAQSEAEDLKLAEVMLCWEKGRTPFLVEGECILGKRKQNVHYPSPLQFYIVVFLCGLCVFQYRRKHCIV